MRMTLAEAHRQTERLLTKREFTVKPNRRLKVFNFLVGWFYHDYEHMTHCERCFTWMLIRGSRQ